MILNFFGTNQVRDSLFLHDVKKLHDLMTEHREARVQAADLLLRPNLFLLSQPPMTIIGSPSWHRVSAAGAHRLFFSR
jgi:hypothetical protein